MDVLFTHGTGLAVHQKTGMACRATPNPTERQADGIIEVQEVGTRPVDVRTVSDGLAQAGMTHGARDSPGE
jgi:hypothetical protein